MRINIYIEKDQYRRLKSLNPNISAIIREIAAFYGNNAEAFNIFFLQMRRSKLFPGRGSRANIHLYQEDLARIDAVCAAHGLNRSAAVRWLIKFWFFRSSGSGDLDAEKIGKALEMVKEGLASISDRVRAIKEQVEYTESILSQINTCEKTKGSRS